MRLDAPWHRLADLPREVWLPSLVASAGETAQRLGDVRRWLDALLAGELPPPDADFGDAAASAPLRSAVGELRLAPLARGVPALAQQVLRTLLWHLDRIVDHQPRLSREAAIARVAADFRAAWQIELHGIEEALALLRNLGDAAAHLQWDELRGRLRAREWREAQRLAELMGRLPALAEALRRLGRAQRAPRERRAPPQAAPQAAHRIPLRWVETRLPDAPGEIKGIRFSDRIERLLGAELAQLRHPVLHKLWRARRAEGRLLAWDSEAVLYDRRPDPLAAPQSAADAPTPPLALERGPIILALDTSGSMRGAPENLAKAVALEAFRVAQRERRACKLLAFGGPGELLERDLAPDRAGLDALLELIGQGFDGGTDVQAPIERALARVHEARWASADLVIVSDGEFGCTGATLAQLDAARDALGLRVQGILLGDRETLGLLDVCDDIFWVRDWRRYASDARTAHADGFTPVHSKSLTALYFPNALSERATRHQPR